MARQASEFNLAIAVELVLAAQAEYFKTRSKEALVRSKTMEKRLAKMAQVRIEELQKQIHHHSLHAQAELVRDYLLGKNELFQ